MASRRHEEDSSRSAEDTVRRAGEQTTEQTRRIGLAAARGAEDAARVSADLIQQNTEIVQNVWRFGVDMATALLGGSADQLGRTLGVSGREAQQAAERSARNAESLLYSGSAMTKGMNGISREYFDLARNQLQKNMEHINELWRCRTPQEFAAVQGDLMRETVSNVFESGRRMADMSLRLADDAGKHITETMQGLGRAA